MQINLSELFSSDGKEKTYTQDIEMQQFQAPDGVYEIAERLGVFQKIAFLDDAVTGDRVIGKLEDCLRYREEYPACFIAIGNNERRRELAEKKKALYAEGLKVPVGSTVGAGDSVVGALAVAEESGMTLEDTVRLSAATGAANVMCS